MKKTKQQEEMIEMINIFYDLSKDKQMYISGLIQGLATKQNLETQQANA